MESIATASPVYNAVSNNAMKRIGYLGIGNTTQVIGGNDTSHLIMTGGRRSIPDCNMDDFYVQLSEYVNATGSVEVVREMPSITENRTGTFPMYYDLDFKLPLSVLDSSAIKTVVQVVVRQTLQFYPVETRGVIGECVILDKSGCATMDADTGLYKHGIHIHFPKLIVENDLAAYQIRLGVLNGLTAFREPWTGIIGIDPGLLWDNIVDIQVYSGGLRMVGAPKAVKCPRTCPSRLGLDPGCDKCNGKNLFHQIDPRAYKLCMVLGADGERNLEREGELRNPYRLLKACTVRNYNGRPVTSGFQIYPGCPPYISSRSGKRQSLTAQLGSKTKVAKSMETVTDPAIIAICRAKLIEFHTAYDSCRIEVRKNAHMYIIILSGDESKFCINANRYHRSNNVWMVIKKCKRNKVDMKCHSLNPEKCCYGQCSNFESPPVYLEPFEKEVLFPGGSSSVGNRGPSSAAATSRSESDIRANPQCSEMSAEQIYNEYPDC